MDKLKSRNEPNAAISEEEFLLGSIKKFLDRKNEEIQRLETENSKLRETTNLLVKTNYNLLGKIDMLEDEICKKNNSSNNDQEKVKAPRAEEAVTEDGVRQENSVRKNSMSRTKNCSDDKIEELPSSNEVVLRVNCEPIKRKCFPSNVLSAKVMRHTSYISQEHNYASKYNKAVDGGDAMEIRKSTNLELPSKEISPTVNDVLEQGHMSIINIAGLIEGGNEVKEAAYELYKEVVENKIFENYVEKIEAAAACLYIARFQNFQKSPHTFQKIMKFSRIKEIQMKKLLRAICRNFKIAVPHRLSGHTDTLLDKFNIKLKLPVGLLNVAKNVASKSLHMKEWKGRKTTNIAAAAAYLVSQASGIKKTVKEVSEATNIRQMYIRRVVRILLNNSSKLFPENFKVDVTASMMT